MDLLYITVSLMSIAEQMALIRSLLTFSLLALVGSYKSNQVCCFLENLLRCHLRQHCSLSPLFLRFRALHHQLHAFTSSKSRQYRVTILQSNRIPESSKFIVSAGLHWLIGQESLTLTFILSSSSRTFKL